MLPSKKRLSRAQFGVFLKNKDTKTVFNKLGTLKYQKSSQNRASVVISSKQQKSAVKRNTLKRRLYSLFEEYFKKSKDLNNYILYTSKQSQELNFGEIKELFYAFFKKNTK